MRKLLFLFAVSGAMISPVLADDSLPLSLSKQCVIESGSDCVRWEIAITGKSDKITVKDVVVNRGNCVVYESYFDLP